jgi:hypothetical protein
LHFQDKTMPTKKAAMKPGFSTLSASSDDDPRTKEDDPRIDEDDFDLEDNIPGVVEIQLTINSQKVQKWALSILFNMLLICASSLANLLW